MGGATGKKTWVSGHPAATKHPQACTHLLTHAHNCSRTHARTHLRHAEKLVAVVILHVHQIEHCLNAGLGRLLGKLGAHAGQLQQVGR